MTLSIGEGLPLTRGAQRTNGMPKHIASQSAETTGSSKQGHTCRMTEAWYYSTYGCNGLCRPLWRYRQQDKPR
jgi:hypothetical protein